MLNEIFFNPNLKQDSGIPLGFNCEGMNVDTHDHAEHGLLSDVKLAIMQHN
jgi:hypothetical protein